VMRRALARSRFHMGASYPLNLCKGPARGVT
jgi:hypothetical protein